MCICFSVVNVESALIIALTNVNALNTTRIGDEWRTFREHLRLMDVTKEARIPLLRNKFAEWKHCFDTTSRICHALT